MHDFLLHYLIKLWFNSRQQYALAQQKVLSSAPPPQQQQLNLLLHQALKIRCDLNGFCFQSSCHIHSSKQTGMYCINTAKRGWCFIALVLRLSFCDTISRFDLCAPAERQSHNRAFYLLSHAPCRCQTRDLFGKCRTIPRRHPVLQTCSPPLPAVRLTI